MGGYTYSNRVRGSGFDGGLVRDGGVLGPSGGGGGEAAGAGDDCGEDCWGGGVGLCRRGGAGLEEGGGGGEEVGGWLGLLSLSPLNRGG